ncbi:beta strand repeat-containing protein [Rhizobium sp. LjRoot254]|uniref:beta strand repeat-containing protein n=1 Tax=Rhizobium sp. LjRoot254 TaxID=3342297 RepID=UPI003ECCD022
MVDINLTAAGASTTINGAIFVDSANVGSGTGNYNTILAISDNDGNETGFNSDDTQPLDPSNEDIDQSKTHTVLLSTVPVTIVNGVEYYEFRVDLNESNSNPGGQISLDTFKIYSSTDGTIQKLAVLEAQTVAYDMDAGGDKTLLLSEVSTGSGTDDYAVLVPVSSFAGADPATTYMYLQVGMGFKGGDYVSQGGFEEWNLQSAGSLTGTKFEDLDGDGIKDAGEPGMGGVTIFIDTDKDGVRDAGERSTVTDANGNYTFFGVPLGTYQIDEEVPAGSTQTTGAFETVTVTTIGQTAVVDPIGNFVPRPGIELIKTATAGQIADTAGEELDYTITVRNTGNVTLTNILVTDNNADAGSVLYASGDTDADNKLDVGETWTYNATHTVTQAELDSNGGGDSDIDNIATVTTQEGPTDDDDAVVPLDQNAGIELIKTATAGQIADTAGEELDYTITVRNTGNVTLTNILVTDNNADAGSVLYASGDTDADNKLDVGETWTYNATHTVTQAELDNNGGGDNDIDNIATVTTQEGPTDDDDAVVPLDQNAGIELIKTATAGQIADTAGEELDYTITVRNTGNVTLTSILVTDNNADAGSVLYASGDTDADNKLDVGETWTYNATHTVTQAELDNNGGGDSDIDNIATVTTQEGPTDDDDAVVPLDQNAGIELIKTATAGQIADTAGEELDYTITVRNTGNVTLTNILVTDNNADAGSVLYASGDTDADNKLDVGETWTYNATHTVTQAELDNNGGGDNDIDNIATVTTQEGPTDDDDAVVPLDQNAGIELIKTATAGQIADTAGEELDYTITVRNTGNVTLTNILVTDNNADAGSVLYASGDTDADNKLDVGETWTYNATHTVTQAELDNNGGGDNDIDNIATVTTQEGPTDDDDAVVPLDQNAGIELIKTATAGQIADTAGEELDYTITVRNTGNVTLTNILVTDNNADAGSVLYASGDTDADNKLDVGETWTYNATHTVTQAELDNNGGGDNDIDNIATVTTQEGPTDDDDAVVPLDQNAGIELIKTATAGQIADTAGEELDYTITVRNTGNVTLTSILVTDNNADAGSVLYASGDTDADNKLDVGETWTYNATHTVTQAELDSNGGGDSDIDNIATVTTQEGPTDNDDAVVPVDQNADIDVEKLVIVNGGTPEDADVPTGPEVAELGADIDFRFVVKNEGNVTLTNVKVTDSKYNLDGLTGDAVLGDNAYTIGNLAVGASITFDFNDAPWEAGQHKNTGTAVGSYSEGTVQDSDNAHYFGLINEGPGVRTPGFWSNLGSTFWNGIIGDEPKQAGTPGFADGELLYKVDCNGDGVLDKKGLLIGDYNKNGLTDGDEDTLFISIKLAQTLIDASQKQQQDGRYMIGRDVVASWLNFLAGNAVGDGSDDTARHFIDEAVDWLDWTDGTRNNGKLDGPDTLLGNAVKTSSNAWQLGINTDADVDLEIEAGKDIHSALDEYNNHGTVNGFAVAHDADSAAFLTALSIASSDTLM